MYSYVSCLVSIQETRLDSVHTSIAAIRRFFVPARRFALFLSLSTSEGKSPFQVLDHVLARTKDDKVIPVARAVAWSTRPTPRVLRCMRITC